MKKAISLALAVILSLSALTLFSASAATKTENVSIRAYCEKFYLEKKSAKRSYVCKVKYNDQKYIKTKFSDDGNVYSLTVRALKATDKTRPVVKVYYVGSDKTINVVKCLRVKVYKAGTVKITDKHVNLGTKKDITINNPFAYSYELKLSKTGIVKLYPGSYQEGIRVTYTIKGLKNGSVTVKAYPSGKKTCVGKFRITVGDYPAKIRSAYKNIKLKFNSHGSSTYMSESHVNISDMIADPRAKAKYGLELSDEDEISTIDGGLVYATGIGAQTAKVTETIGGETKTVGTVSFKVVNAKMAYVVKQNAMFYDDGIFGNGDFTEYLNLKDEKKFSMKPVIGERLLNNSYTGSSFKSSDYTITYSSSAPKVAKVSSGGTVTALKAGNAKITYTITFSDKSSYSNTCHILVENE